MKKCDEALREHEDKLHLGAQFQKSRQILGMLQREVREAGDIPKERREELLRSLSELQEAVG